MELGPLEDPTFNWARGPLFSGKSGSLELEKRQFAAKAMSHSIQ